MNEKRKVILDCDPGHDDAFAIMLAAAHLDLLGITTIGGNCSLENVTANALKVLEVIGRGDVGVYPGHAHPLVSPLVTAPQFHGISGMDGPVLPEPSIRPKSKHGVDFIVETVMRTEEVTLIATGPLTNIAAAINREPKIVKRVRELCLMGGSVTFGNWTPAAEFNIFVDPEAAYRVFESGLHVKMCGVNLTRQCFLVQKHVDEFYRIATKTARFAAELVEFFMKTTEENAGLLGANLHDACAVAWLIDDGLVRSAPMHVTVELKGEFTRGMTVCDSRHLRVPKPSVDLSREAVMDYRGKEPNAEAGLELDFDGFMTLLNRTLACYP